MVLISAISSFAIAQGTNGSTKTSSKIQYHNGPVRTGVRTVYFIFYGCWGTCGPIVGDDATPYILTDFVSTIGNTPYMRINSTYTDGAGQPATGALVFAGMVFDASYSRGVPSGDLTVGDIEGLISDQVSTFRLPQDPNGIYVVAASADLASTATGFCSPGTPPFHNNAEINGTRLDYIFLGNPNRCQTVAGAPYFAPGGTGLTTPNGSFSGDAMATNLAHALNGLLTDPLGNGWYDRYGLENADKCALTFGQTYATANGARANIHLGSRDFLLEQNWINDRKARCGMF